VSIPGHCARSVASVVVWRWLVAVRDPVAHPRITSRVVRQLFSTLVLVSLLGCWLTPVVLVQDPQYAAHGHHGTNSTPNNGVKVVTSSPISVYLCGPLGPPTPVFNLSTSPLMFDCSGSFAMSNKARHILKCRCLAPGIPNGHCSLCSTIFSGRKHSDLVFVRKGQCGVHARTSCQDLLPSTLGRHIRSLSPDLTSAELVAAGRRCLSPFATPRAGSFRRKLQMLTTLLFVACLDITELSDSALF